MKRAFLLTLVFAGCLAAVSGVCAQAPTGGNGTGSTKSNTPNQGQPPAAPQAGSNPFPEDTTSVPVMPSSPNAAPPEVNDQGSSSAGIPIVGDDNDPVRSPDDPLPATTQDQESSSNFPGMDRIVPPPDDAQPDKKDGKRKLGVKEDAHPETASEDINVGGYYLEKKNWKAAQSRFESAMVLDPENPEVYWGLAEAAHHLGSFAQARNYYQKVVDYDPDSKHGKEARKELRDPEIANATSAAPVTPATNTP